MDNCASVELTYFASYEDQKTQSIYPAYKDALKSSTQSHLAKDECPIDSLRDDGFGTIVFKRHAIL